MEFDGQIKFHQCNEYDDKAISRTPKENEFNEQARRFAQYYVYLERGYDTVPPRIHPERLNAVRIAIAGLSESAFEQYFGDLYQQLRSYEDATVDRVIDVPSAASSSESVLYRKHVYLGLDPLETALHEEAENLAGRYGLDLTETPIETRSLEEPTTTDLETWERFSQELMELAADENVSLSDGLQLGGVSSVHMAYIDDAGEEHVTESVEPFDREPDTRIELPVMDIATFDEFRDYLNHNLACQVRDCFIRMGLEPPEPFQILGYGDFEAAEQYNRLEMYPNYIDPTEKTAFI
ncbi:hypothetical protein [Natrinema salifodinae]|nr:hypothetical protein [Natrinema salifodinae]